MKSFSVWLIAAALLMIAGCGNDDNSNPTGPRSDPAFITLSIEPNVVDFAELPDDSATVQVTATVYYAQNFPVRGVTVHFYAQRGWIDSTAVTDLFGRAVVNWSFTENDMFADEVSPEYSSEASANVGEIWQGALLLVKR